jgi:hypothetical protein
VPQGRPGADRIHPRAGTALAPPLRHAGRTDALKVSEVMGDVTIARTDVKGRVTAIATPRFSGCEVRERW